MIQVEVCITNMKYSNVCVCVFVSLSLMCKCLKNAKACLCRVQDISLIASTRVISGVLFKALVFSVTHDAGLASQPCVSVCVFVSAVVQALCQSSTELWLLLQLCPLTS